MTEPSPMLRPVGRYVSDLERNLVADQLSEAFGSGQLTREEFEHRVSRALDARTDLDLALLTSGLREPAQAAPSPGPRRSVVDLSALDLVIAAVALAAIGVVSLWLADVMHYGNMNWLLAWVFGALSAGLGAFIAGNRRRKL